MRSAHGDGGPCRGPWTSRLAASALLVLLLACLVEAQEFTAPIVRGEALISGRVIERDTERPLEGVTISLIDMQRRRQVDIQSDADGRFRFEKVGAGNYRVRATHVDYVAVWQEKPEVKVGAFNRPGEFAVGPRDRIALADFVLERGGEIRGRVTDQLGRPIEHASVRAMLVNMTRPTSLIGVITTTTDASGAYRLKGVPEGEFVINVSATGLRGGIKDGVRQSDGKEYEQAFYPGVISNRDAVYVRVTAGQVVNGINVLLREIQYFTLSGQMVGTHPLPETFDLVLTGSPSGSTQRPSRAVKDDGTFVFERLKPGRYILWGRAETPDGVEAASLAIDVESDLNSVRLELAASGRISGQVVTERGDALPIEGFRLAAALLDNTTDIDVRSIDSVEVAANGSFAIGGLFGDRLLRAYGLPEGWRVVRVEQDRKPVETLTMNPGSHHQVVVVIGQR